MIEIIALMEAGLIAFLLFVLFGAVNRCQDLEQQRDDLRRALRKRR